MIRILNAVAVTLLAAVVSVFPAALIGPYVPGVFNPSLKPVAVAAWLSGLICWWVSRMVTRKELQQQHHHEETESKANGRTVGITVAFLALALGIVAVLHFYGDRLIG